MPSAGTAMVPSAKQRHTSRTYAADVTSSAHRARRTGTAAGTGRRPARRDAGGGEVARPPVPAAVRRAGAGCAARPARSTRPAAPCASGPNSRRSRSARRGRAAQRVAERVQRAVARADRGAGHERAQAQRVEVHRGPQRRVGGVEHLEPAVAAEPVHDVGGHPAARAGRRRPARTRRARAAPARRRRAARARPAPTTTTSCASAPRSRPPRAPRRGSRWRNW